jgi:hypothetical protein
VLRKAYACEHDLNVELFNTLRACLVEAHVVDAVNVTEDEDTRDLATKNEAKDCARKKKRTTKQPLTVAARNATTNNGTTMATSNNGKAKIIFTHGTCDGYAIGIAREANGERKQENQSAFSSSAGKRKRDESTSSFGGNSQQTDSGVGAMTRVDHCACLFVEKDGKREVLCLSAIELKLAKAPVRCAAIPKGATAEALAKNLELGKSHGSIAQVMLYTMGWALHSLAKLGQLDAEIPFGVVVCEHQSNKTTPSPFGSIPTLEQSSSSTASKPTAQKLTSSRLPFRQTKSNQINPSPSDGSNGTPSDQTSDRSNPIAINANNAASQSDASIETSLGDWNVTSQSNQSNRWVSGRIYVPEACGDFFEYAVTGFGGFEPAERNESVDNALSIYLDTLLFGLLAAREWLMSFVKGESCRSLPTSGQVVMIGNKKLTLPRPTPTSSHQAAPVGEDFLTLRGRPGKLADVAPNDNRPYSSEWTINQGEILTGTLNIRHLTQEFRLGEANFLAFTDQDADVKVAMKISSLSVHDYLTDPMDAFVALNHIHQEMVKTRTWLKQHEEWKQKVKMWTTYLRKNNLPDVPELAPEKPSTPRSTPCPMLDDVLLAVCCTPKGLITIMNDLSEDYTTLRPCDYEDDLVSVWTAYVELLRNVLIPMADLNIIHPDIRPGYDETSNILCKFEEVQGKGVMMMKIIDFESLLLFSQWAAPDGAQSLYIDRKVGPNAKTFLWWQCVALAYAWKEGKTQKEMAACNLEELVKEFEKKRSLHPWLKNFYSTRSYDRPPEKEMDYHLLKNLVKVFI